MAKEAESDKSKLGLVLAVVAGLLAMGMVFVFLQKVKRDASATSSGAGANVRKTEVLVAVKDLPSGHILNVNTDLKKMTIPVSESTEEFARQCVPANRATELEGRRLGVGIASQFPLLFSNLVDSARIDDDFTDGYLKTIEVDKTNLIGNQLVPGDRVVILATLPKKKEKKEKKNPVAPMSPTQIDPAAITSAILQSMPSMNPADTEVETVLVMENAEVFLVGSMRKIDRVQMSYLPMQRQSASEITLRLTMAEAMRLTQFENTPGAKLTLLLTPRKKAAE